MVKIGYKSNGKKVFDAADLRAPVITVRKVKVLQIFMPLPPSRFLTTNSIIDSDRFIINDIL